ncbi:ABC transporter ATP-binding protein [Acidimicrobiaceae bacterium]|nr:ABC transporter ATP-binding protein [Acidimicrobiaceae bacterium]|tara:strand:+ start:687 stop:1403 length:717 start_codon:yes stop_codon:yes gene_type:complete
MINPIIEVNGLASGYVKGLNILQGVDLVLKEKEIVSIIGPNGAGKSTLLKAIVGLIPIFAGKIYFNGEHLKEIKSYELAQTGIGYVPQVQNVFPSLTVEENLEMGNWGTKEKKKDSFIEIYEMFSILFDKKKERAGNLSGGQRQLLALGRALISKPNVILLDEPSAGLSPKAIDEVFEYINIINQNGVSILLVEQNAKRALKFCDRGYVLDQGRNAYTGSGEVLLNDPKVVELYLGKL